MLHTSLTRRDFIGQTVLATASLAAVARLSGAPTSPAPGPRTEVRRHRGRPIFFLDGEPYSKPVFETYVPQTKYFRQFAEAGTDVFSFSTNLGGGFAAPTWLGPDAWDFRQLDELAHRVLAANPRGYLMPRILHAERTFRDPATEMAVIDWYLFFNELIPDTIDHFARAAKEALDRRQVVGTFYAYLFEFGGDPEYGHNALGRLLRSPHLDFVAVTASYHDRALGHGADDARAPITSVGLHGKLWYHDNDTVSFRYDAMNAGRQDRETVARYRKELGVTETAQETIWQYRRGAGFVLGHGIYQSFFDLHGGYFDDPALLAEVQRLNRLLADAKHHGCSSVAEILVVSDEASCGYATFESGLLQQTLQPTQVQLAKLGAPHVSILVDDLALAELRRYRFVIFLNCFHLSDAQRRLIRRRVLNRNRTVLWCYAPGLFNRNTQSVEAMRHLTGLRLALAVKPDRVRARIELTQRGSALGSETAPFPQVVGHEHVWAQLISVEDDTAAALGTLEGRADVVLAMKSLRGWTSIYTLNPVLPAAFLRALARRAGVHLYNDRDDTLYASRSFLCVNADGAGERTLCLPQPSDLFDPFTGECVARNATRFLRRMESKETILLRHVRV